MRKLEGGREVEKTAQQGALWFLLLTKYYSDDQIKKNEMGVACGTCGGDERCIRGFGEETQGKETTWKT